MVASGDYIRAKSRYYNQPEFSNVSIKMSEEEVDDYNTDEGSCFGKVRTISIKLQKPLFNTQSSNFFI